MHHARTLKHHESPYDIHKNCIMHHARTLKHQESPYDMSVSAGQSRGAGAVPARSTRRGGDNTVSARTAPNGEW